ncbi:MAG: exo-alpha-sialidase [Ilumatobacter sp.]|nr:exo-alpha-sialidase [Ilumatobacter sp.]
MSRRLAFVIVSLTATGACGADAEPSSTALATEVTEASRSPSPSSSPPSTRPNVSTTVESAVDPDGPIVIDLAGAIAVNVTAAGERAALAWSADDAVWTADVDTTSGTIGEPIAVNGDLLPFPNPIERPAVAIDARGRTHVAFTTLAGALGSVGYSVLDGGRVDGPVVVSGEPRIETVLVHMTESPAARPTMAWLEDSSLTVAVPDGDGPPVERDGIDDQTCDCCNPAPVLLGDELVVAYRDLERTDDAVIRDVVAIRSTDGGAVFSPIAPIADESWFIDACPFSGPDMIELDGELITSWMDARQSLHPDQESTTIWVDRSLDGGRSFGPDLAITEGGIHRWPMLAATDDGVIHLVWETQDRDAGGISYARSADRGVSFDAPRLLLPNDERSGRRRAPSIAAAGDRLLVTWIDSTGGHLASVDPSSLR